MVDLDLRGLEILCADECLSLLQPGGIGRLCWIVDHRPVVRPVNFALKDRQIIVKTGEGGIYAAACSTLPISFEVDSFRNLDHSAWSVIIDGTLGLIDDEVALHVPLRSWAPGSTDRFVEITIEAISGRRIARDG